MDRMGGGGEEKSLVLSPPPLPTRVLWEKSPTSLLLLYPSLARMSSQALLPPPALGLCSGHFLCLDRFPHRPSVSALPAPRHLPRVCSDITLSSPRGLPARLSNTVTYLSTPPSSLPRSTFVLCFHRTYHLLPYYTVDFLCFLFVSFPL